MVDDGRSKKIIFLAHCLLNTNAIAVGPMTPTIWPAMIDEIIDVLKEKKVSIVQLSCPEQLFFGIVRGKDAKQKMDKPEFRNFCKKLAKESVSLIEKYKKNGFDVLGIVGKRGSPSCGVKETWVTDKKLKPEKGIFIEELEKVLNTKNINTPFIDFEREKIRESISDLKNLTR